MANGARAVVEPYAAAAGEAAIEAAKRGDLQLRNVNFAYPVRQQMPSGWRGRGGRGGVTGSL